MVREVVKKLKGLLGFCAITGFWIGLLIYPIPTDYTHHPHKIEEVIIHKGDTAWNVFYPYYQQDTRERLDFRQFLYEIEQCNGGRDSSKLYPGDHWKVPVVIGE